MTSRQFLDTAIVSAHQTLMEHALFAADESMTDAEHETQAIEIARLSALYGMQLLFRWQKIMSVMDRQDTANVEFPTTKNLSRPETDPL
jgi:hypothetical protein